MTVGGMLLVGPWELGTVVYHDACRVPAHYHTLTHYIHTHVCCYTHVGGGGSGGKGVGGLVHACRVVRGAWELVLCILKLEFP